MTPRDQDSPVARVLDALERMGCSPRKTAGGWQARCPAHDDLRPSLSLNEGRDGRALLKCWAGCETNAVLQALGLRWTDLFPSNSALGGRGL
jgi:putative DNA primase/helicase